MLRTQTYLGHYVFLVGGIILLRNRQNSNVAPILEYRDQVWHKAARWLLKKSLDHVFGTILFDTQPLGGFWKKSLDHVFRTILFIPFVLL